MVVRKIIHVDMDAFYAAVEQRDNPDYRDKPVIIGGPASSRGVVSTASYEARVFGVRSAMPMTEAVRRCPQGIFLPGNHAKYRAVSRQLHGIFADYTPLYEPLALDEAFLDVTGCEGLFGSATKMGRDIQARIERELGLTASIGVSFNKFLAKLASDLKKPKGFVVIRPGEELPLLRDLPVERLWGVGPKTATQLRELGLKTMGEIVAAGSQFLEERFGSSGHHLFELAQGIDRRLVVPEHDPKSVGHETTFPEDIGDVEQLLAVLSHLAQEVGRRLRQHKLKGKTVIVKVRNQDFVSISRSRTLDYATNLDGEIIAVGKELLSTAYQGEQVRLIGITVSKLEPDDSEEQLQLFAEGREKQKRLTACVDHIKDKYGNGAIALGPMGTSLEHYASEDVKGLGRRDTLDAHRGSGTNRKE